ncbi:hypothetical protein [Caballeronia sordidicola]|uniref:hypothetical protein n=1 Tax=Caballeronia sordidicola TaxID=196367 RepID=UPI000B7898F0|nr:hypothetical protein [Caballeronia sordidicola]
MTQPREGTAEQILTSTPDAIQPGLSGASRKERLGKVLIVNMGQPVKIVDLSHNLTRSHRFFEIKNPFRFFGPASRLELA